MRISGPQCTQELLPKKKQAERCIKIKLWYFPEFDLWINKHHVVLYTFYKVYKLTTKHMNFKPPQVPADLYPCQWLVILNLAIKALEDLWVNQKNPL